MTWEKIIIVTCTCVIILKAKFEVESAAHVRYIFKSLNTKWTEYRK